jgi:peptidyl-prolyl cis-trans isomerase D
MKTSVLFFLFSLIGQFSFAQESDSLKQWEKLKRDFKQAKDDAAFCKANSDHPYVVDKISSAYYLDAHLYDSLKNKPVGEVVGPFISNTWLNENADVEKNTFILKLVKLDSCFEIRASHILFEGTNYEQRERNRKIADSLLAIIKGGVPFAGTAKKYGHDGTEFNGGDLGWFKQGSMVKAFDAACFSAKKGDVFIVETPFGLHLVKITEDKRMRVCQYEIVPIVKTNKKVIAK